MWGKIEKQVDRLFNTVADSIGESRHLAKEEIRQSGVKGHTNVAKVTGIFSYGTSNTYVPIWKEFARWGAENKNLKDLEKVSNRMMKEFLQTKMKDCNKYASYSKICSAMTKFEATLNRYALQEETGRTYNFQKIIDNVRKVASHDERLGKSIQGRGFEDRFSVVRMIDDKNHQFAARFQAETGCRVYEAARLHIGQLRGVGKDPYNQREVGIVQVQGKGGKIRDVYLEPKSYRELEGKLKEMNGEIKINIRKYTDSVKAAAYLAGENYTGTHDFRHAWVQDRFKELTEKGYSDEQSLAGVSEEIGHVRPDITEVYLK